MIGVEQQVIVGPAQVLPSGFALPPLPYLVGLVLGTLIVATLLVLVQPPVTGWDVLALGVWMAVGGALHVFYQIEAFPSGVEPLMGTPAVYLTTFVVAGGLWLVAAFGTAAGMFSSAPRIVGAAGVAVGIVLVAFLVFVGQESGTIAPLWPTVGLFASVLVAALAFIALSLTYTDAVATTGKVGAFVVFAHTLDGVTTAIGIDVIGVEERTPLPRLIMDLAGDLPTAEIIGSGWLFVLTKVVLALLIVAVFADYVKEQPSRGNLALALLAAIGVGPGVHNLLLFLVGAGA